MTNWLEEFHCSLIVLQNREVIKEQCSHNRVVEIETFIDWKYISIFKYWQRLICYAMCLTVNCLTGVDFCVWIIQLVQVSVSPPLRKIYPRINTRWQVTCTMHCKTSSLKIRHSKNVRSSWQARVMQESISPRWLITSWQNLRWGLHSRSWQELP